jgi:hypothetical protein
MVRRRSTPISQDRLLAVARQLHGIGTEVDAGFVDVSINTVNSSVRIWRLKDEALDDAVRRRYQAVAADVSLEYSRAELSNEQKSELDGLMSVLAPALRQAGVRPTSWGTTDGLDHPYVVTYVGKRPPRSELVERFQIFGEGSVAFRERDVVNIIYRR